MRNFLSTTALVLISFFQTQAQNHIAGMGGPVLKAGKTGNSTEIYVGGLGAMTINHFYLGGGGFSLVGEAFQGSEAITFGYGGLLAGYQNRIKSRMGFFFHSLFASGGGELGANNDFSAFIVEPEIGMNFYVTPFMQIKPGFSYRLLSFTEPLNTEPELGGGFFNLTFSFGYFK